MRLDSVVIAGFRKYAEPFELDFSPCLTAIVGQNDAGKSTILEALNIYFGNAKLESGDFSVGSEEPVSITAVLSDLPEKLILDADRTTNLAAEYLVDADGRLRLRKSWRRRSSTPEVHAIAIHPRRPGEEDFLVNAKIARLRTLAESLQVADRRVSSDLRRAILQDLIVQGAPTVEVAVPLTSDDGKAVAAALEQYLPQYYLFRADRAGSESDSLAQDPAKAAIRVVLAEREDELAELSRKVVSQITTLLEGVVEKLRDIDPALADRLSLTDPTPDWSKAFSSLRFEDDQGVPLSKRGNGTRRLVLLSFFRATVEASGSGVGARRSVITAIEEPETALHPDLQRELIRTIQELGSSSRRQALITTHSSNLVRDLPAESLRYITRAEVGGPQCLSVGADGDATSLLRALNGSLGILTDHSVRCFVMVEGRNDIEGLKAMGRGLRRVLEVDTVDVAELERRGHLCLLPIGGCGSLSLWEENLTALSRPQYCIVDSDRDRAGGELKHDVQAMVDRSRVGRSIVVLERRELENYLVADAVVDAYSDVEGFAPRFAAAVADRDWDYLDVPMECARVIHELAESGNLWSDLDPAVRKSKEGRVKKRLVRAFEHPSVAQSLVDSEADVLTTLRAIGALACAVLPVG